MKSATTASKGDARRETILAQARALLVEKGYDRFVLRDIAERVGVTLGNLQYYYPTRDDLLEAVIRSEFEANRREIERLSASRLAARRRLEQIARHLISVWAHDGGRIYVVMSLLALHHRRFRKLHQEIYDAFYDGLLPVLGELRPDRRRAELLAVARLVTTIIDGAVAQTPSRAFVTDAVRLVVALGA